jgi:hypothetical protein
MSLGRWRVWFFVAFLASLVAAFSTRSILLWMLAFILAQCAAFARAAARRKESL